MGSPKNYQLCLMISSAFLLCFVMYSFKNSSSAAATMAVGARQNWATRLKKRKQSVNQNKLLTKPLPSSIKILSPSRLVLLLIIIIILLLTKKKSRKKYSFFREIEI